MMVNFAVSFINLFAFVFNIILLARVVWSWFNPSPEGGLGALLFDLTEPVLAPVRAILPKSQMIDFSPLVVFIALQLITELVNRAVTS